MGRSTYTVYVRASLRRQCQPKAACTRAGEGAVHQDTDLAKLSGSATCSSQFQECLQQLVCSLEKEFERILMRAREHESQVEKALARVTLLSRREAARRLSISLANFDRKVASGQLQAVYIDAHPRVQLTELARFIEAYKSSSLRRCRRR
jgi:hypothetical protein